MNSKLPAEPALIGRNQEIKQLTQLLDSALNGKGTTVFICGEAGIGKTRLANEFLNLAGETGARVLKGWCLSEAAIPYFPFTEAFNTYMSTISDEKARSAMRKGLGITGWLRGPESTWEPKAREPHLTPEITRDRTFEAAAKIFLQLSATEPLILFLDDLQWADQLSLALLHYLSRKCSNSRLLIIGTYRPEEIVSAKEERLHPLEETMFSMSREDLLTKMDLNRLKRDDFPELLRSIFRLSTDEKFVDRLYKETEGNPFFVLETLNLLVDEGFLSDREGQWIITAPTEEIGIPSKVHDVITRRIARLRREQRKVLDVAAVCGYFFNPDTLSRVLALDIADVLQTLVEIEQRHKLIRSADSAFEFTHHKIREVMYVNLPGGLRRVYHLRTASCLEQALAERVSDGYVADLALHYVEGGAPEKAFEYLVDLGEKAVDVFANVQAIDYLNKALEAAQETPSLATSENLAKVYKLRGRAWLGQEDPPQIRARNDFQLMLQNATKIGDESMIAEAHYWLGSAYSAYYGELDGAMRHLTTALEISRKIGNKPLEGRSLEGLGANLIATLDAMDEGRIRLEESLKVCEEVGDKVAVAANLEQLGWYYNWKGEFQRAEEYLKKALALAEEIGGVPILLDKLFMLTIVYAGNGEYNEAISTGQKCLQLARDSGRVSRASWILNTLGWIYHDLSNIELASKYNRESIEFARAHQRSEAWGGVPHALVNLGMDCLCKNDYESADKHFKEASGLHDQHPTGWWRLEARILLGRGEISLAEGDYAQALRFAEESLAIFQKAGSKKYIAKGWKLKAEILAKMGNPMEAIDLMGDALKLAQQVSNPPLLWQIHHSLGLLLEKHGDPQGANENHAKAITLIETTAEKLHDPSLTNTLLTAPLTKAIRDAYAKAKPTQ